MMRPCGILFFAATFCLASVAAPEDSADRPNVIWVVMDALRSSNLSCYGYERNTSPELDDFAEGGLLCENHYTQGLWTTLSVPSYMTGRYFPVLVHETIQGAEIERELPEGELLFPEIMRANGYHTAMLTSHAWFSPKSRLWQSFDEAIYVGPRNPSQRSYATMGELNRRAFRWLDSHKRDRFFLYYHVLDTHFPHNPQPPYDLWMEEDFSTDKLKNGMPTEKHGVAFTEEEQEYLRGLYDGSLRYANVQFGLLMWRLKRLGLDENTIVVVSSDHGDLLAEDGTTWGHPAVSYENLLRTPFIIAGPGIPSGKRYSGITENVDITATLVDVLNLASNAEMDGVSVLSLLNGSAKPKRFALSKYTHGGYDGAQAIVLTGPEYKYETNIESGEEWLWRVPDEMPRRTDLKEQEPEVLQAIQDYAQEQILPRYQAYRALPPAVLHMNFRDTIQNHAGPAEALVIHGNDEYKAGDALWKDGKWGYDKDWLRLWARPWLEDLPPLNISYPAENGRYQLDLSMFISSDYVGHVASGVRIKVEGDAEYRLVKHTESSLEEPDFEFVPAGEVTIEDGTLDIVLEEADSETWVVIRGMRLTRLQEGEQAQAPPSQAGTMEEVMAPEEEAAPLEEDDRMEQLRALGYVN